MLSERIKKKKKIKGHLRCSAYKKVNEPFRVCVCVCFMRDNGYNLCLSGIISLWEMAKINLKLRGVSLKGQREQYQHKSIKCVKHN